VSIPISQPPLILCIIEGSAGTQGLRFLFDRPFVSAFVSTDYARSWESREAWGPHLLRFQMFETCVRDQGSQILHAAPPGVKARSPALAFLLALEIGNNQSPPWLKHPGDFSKPLTFEGSR
jgi:hypothetical protein